MWFSRWFKQAAAPLPLAWDMHAHWLPGVDDGVLGEAETFEVLRGLMALGCEGAVATPHIYHGLFENQEADLRRRFADLQAKAAEQVPGFQMQLGAEYMFDEVFYARLTGGNPDLLRFGPKQDLLLVELPVRGEPVAFGEALDHCRRMQTRVIVAHVERYAYTAGPAGLERLLDWRGRGALLQLNASSCAGAYGPAIRKSAHRIWREGLVDFVGSDLHRLTPGLRWHTAGLAWLAAHPQDGFGFNRELLG